MEVVDVKRLRRLSTVSARLTRLVAEAMFENVAMKELLKNGNRTGSSGLGAVDADDGNAATSST